MKISVFGLGYVGSVTAACLAHEGHEIVGVDIDTTKTNAINDGRSPVIERGLDEIVSKTRSCGSLTATTDPEEAVAASDVSLVCVGTPSSTNGRIDLTFVERVCEDIGACLRNKNKYHVVVFRSTMIPGSSEDLLLPLLESSSGKQAPQDFAIAVNPEFLREGESISDFFNPSRIVIGTHERSASRCLKEVYKTIDSPLLETTLRTAEMIKYIDNSFHALKVCFANEIAEICQLHDIDPYEAMTIFAQDTTLNISTAYLRPGFAFGGSCLPKDLRAIVHKARQLDLTLPLLGSILPSNELQIRRATDRILSTGGQTIGVLGLSFKPGTDDVRESPIIDVIETLIGKGRDVRIFDELVAPARLFGSNKVFLERQLSHVSSLMSDDLDEVLASDVIVIASRRPAFTDVNRRLRSDQIVIDLVGIDKPSLSTCGPSA